MDFSTAYKKSWYGYHFYDIPKGAVNIKEVMQWGYAITVIYNPILGLIKASFVITLIKLKSPNRWINHSLYFIFVINALFTISAPLICAFQCRPVSNYWNGRKNCINGRQYTYGTIGVVLVTDVMVLVMPTWIIYKLQMQLRNKVMIISFLSFGLAVTGIGAYRLYAFSQFFNKNIRNPDGSYSVRQALSNVEVNLAAIGACGATVKWLLGLCIPFFSSQDTKFSKYHSPGGSGFSSERKRYARADLADITRLDDYRSAGRGDMEMNVPGWPNTAYLSAAKGPKTTDFDARSDELRLQGQGYVIKKTFEWDVASGRRTTPPRERESHVKPMGREARPSYVV
ncbi:hypothetical protein P154DRAFT_567780 [Amniculicola lignicola CBS 123094]|uniref:Rhodopsin domain-containing protein n=1 Tax=Amniculicola lignicola CBS 123094 TaxID=1392246 RepID=A0A6A5W3S8_9PLEO|nr:hypothetical protein P154DRAFT_567780 [Amniculicola lignicola CBS 123094]